jgi:hypothetical protein
MMNLLTEEQRLTQRRYIALALSGKRRKVPGMVRRKREKLPSTLPWS